MQPLVADRHSHAMIAIRSEICRPGAICAWKGRRWLLDRGLQILPLVQDPRLQGLLPGEWLRQRALPLVLPLALAILRVLASEMRNVAARRRQTVRWINPGAMHWKTKTCSRTAHCRWLNK
jgi:hypothetical protein